MAVHRCRIIMTKRSGLSWNKGSVKRRKDKFLTDKAFAQSNGKNGFIELCRFVFCWGVVSHHAKFLSESPGYIPIFGGYISVEFFFILTGYLMYASYHKAQSAGKEQDSAIHQIYVKLKRIYPYFLVTFCAVFILVHIRRVLPPPPREEAAFWDLLLAVPQFFFLQCAGLAGNGYIYDGTTWFLSALLVGMLIVYPLMCWGKKYYATAVAPILCLLSYARVITISGNLGPVIEWAGFFWAGCLRAIAGLCLGSFCCYIVQSVPGHSLTKLGDIILSFFQLGIVAFSLFLMSHTEKNTDIVQVVLFSLLIIISFAEETTMNRICNTKICFVLGTFSMIVFITQPAAFCRPDLLFYTERWRWRYAAYIAYVILFSLANYLIVKGIKRCRIVQRLQECLWESLT